MALTGKDIHRQDSALNGKAQSVSVRSRQCFSPPPSSELVANAALSLLNICCHLLDRQILSLADTFEKEGGFTERLYRMHTRTREF